MESDNTVSSYFGNLISAAAVGLGIDTGENAAKTIGNVVKSTASNSSSSAGQQIAASAGPIAATTEKKFLGMDQKTAILVGAGVVILIVAIYAMEK